VMKDSLLSGFTLSSLIHAALIPTASLLIAGTEAMTPTQRIEVSLTDIPAVEQKPEPAPAPKPAPKKVEKIKAPRLIEKTDIARVEPNEPPPKVEEPPPPPQLTASGPEKGSVASKAPAGEAAGGEAGVGSLFAGGDAQVAGGMGGGGGGTAVAGLGRGEKGDGFGGGGNGDGLAALARPLGGYQVKPRYPESARRAGAQGVTLLRVRVLENGRVGEVLVEKSAGYRDLDFSAAEAVKKWLFEPARRGKEPVQVWVLLPVKFELH
jgi:protein TonB